MPSTRIGQRNTFQYSPDVLINYEIDGAGPIAVVFLHGFAASLVTWHDIRKLFPGDRFRLYLLDLKGFGFSSKPRDGDYGVADQAEIVIAFIKAHGLCDAVIIGHSFGGSVALQAALKCRSGCGNDLIGKLVLLDCAAYPQPMPRLMRILRRPVLARLLMLIIPVRLIIRHTLTRTFHDRETVTPAIIERYANCFARRGMADVLVRTVGRLAVDEARFNLDYRTISIPTLIVWGREDRITGLWQARRLHMEIADSLLVILDGCGHNPHEEYPEKIFAVINEFVEELL